MAAGRTGGRTGGLALRWALWRAGRGPVPGLVRSPGPREVGAVARGDALAQGAFWIDGAKVRLAPGQTIWDAATGPAAQGFGWLDDLAARPNAEARAIARGWTAAWLAGQARAAAAWDPAVAARRAEALLRHFGLLTEGVPDPLPEGRLLAVIARHGRYLAGRLPRARAAGDRLALGAALVAAGTALAGQEALAGQGAAAVAEAAAALVGKDGATASRSPEALLGIAAALLATEQALTEAGLAVPEAIPAALGRAAPVLRMLRHADGGLARFHGGGRGRAGTVDRVLAAAAARLPPPDRPAMGYVRLAAGRTTVIADNAAPPGGAAAATAHAGTLGFELTSGRRPVVIGCGPGGAFGADWAQAGRATASHSTLSVEGTSSSRLGTGAEAQVLVSRARVPAAHQLSEEGDRGAYAVHDGWSATHGLLHARTLILSADGRALYGEDRLYAGSPDRRRRLAELQAAPGGVVFALRFHLHPDALPDEGGRRIALRSGEVWEFLHQGPGLRLTVEPSVMLDSGLPAPVPTQVITLTGRLTEGEVRIGWTFAKAEDTPTAIRDLEP